jgi:hypothetical protein
MAYNLERATVTQGIKLAVETTKGTAPSSGYKRVNALGWTFTPSPTIQTFRPVGQKNVTVTALNREETSMAIDGIPTYTDIVYLLNSVLTEGVITAGSGTTAANAGSRTMHANATHHFFRPLAADADTPLTYTVYQGSVAWSHRVSYVQVHDFGMTLNRNDTALTAAAMGKAIEDNQFMPGDEVQTLTIDATGGTFTLTFGGAETGNIDWNATEAEVLTALEALSTVPVGALRVEQSSAVDAALVCTIEFGGSLGETNQTLTADGTNLTGGAGTATPVETTAGAAITSVGLTPILPTQIIVYAFDAAETNISTTANNTAANQFTDLMELELIISGRNVPYWTLDSSLSSFAGQVETEPTFQMRIKQQANAEGMGLLTQMRASSTKFIRVRCVGAALGTDAYEFTMDFAGQVSDVSDFSDEEGLFAITWTLDAVPELTNGGAIEVAVVNNVTAL